MKGKTPAARLLALAAVLIALPAAAQRDFSKVEIKATKVAGKIYMLEGAGGNIGVSVGSDGLLIVDDQFAPMADKIRAALKGLGEGKLKFVLNTHWHGDHTGGNQAFGPEAPIIAHDNVRKRLATEQTVLGETTPPSPPEALPVITFDESLSVHFNGEEIRVIHFPNGHTDGDSVIFFTGSNVVHMGDDFFHNRFPFVDLASGGSVLGLTRNIKAVLGRLPADVKIIPGHGPLSTKADLERYHRMLVETTAIVSQRVHAGKTLEQIQAEGLPAEWKDWGSGFIDANRWLSIVHQSLAKGMPEAPAHQHGPGTGAHKH
ncbi:MAG TPA: MBL fold metallo-hydrolase [Thermoanaerobaculia bacterium]|nr:MBL fold metallo-hydrolase [Thermoanaerobaculia bacterium]